MTAETPAAPAIRIVLVEPSHPGNIGAAARAMKTMGFDALTLVQPRRFPDPQAEWRAAAAVDVLRNAAVCDSLSAAIADCSLVAGTSARRRHVPWPWTTAAGFARQVARAGEGTRAGPVAVLFGREASGLTNDELASCQVHVEIPAHPVYPSLNLAMAVQVVCYELRQARLGDVPAEPVAWDRPLASAAELEGFYGHLEQVLGDIGFLHATAPYGATLTRLKRLFGRMQLDATEVAMLRGVLRHVERASARPADEG